MRWHRSIRLAACLAVFSAAIAAHSAPISLTGQLDPNNPQDVVLRAFTLSAPGAVTIQSWGYGGSAGAPGGTNAAGAAIAAGGFDPYVSVFTGSGPTATFLASNDDGSCPPGTIADALCGDSTFIAVLGAGTYTLAISAFLNMSLAENLGSGNLGDGFVGLGSFGTRTNAYAVDISGSSLVVPPLVLSYVPNGLTFGPQTLNIASGPLAVIVTNAGTGSVSLGALTPGGPDASRFTASTNCTGTLAPAASCFLSVTFTPTAVGPASATMSLASNASNAPIVFAVGGTGTTDPVAIAALSATNLDFGTRPIGSSTTLPLTVTNTGGAALSIGTATLSGPQSADFAIVSDGCSGQVVAASGQCVITIRFHPLAGGLRAGALTITSDASSNPTVVALSGAGAQPTPTPVPALSSPLLALLSGLLALMGFAAARRSGFTRYRAMRRFLRS